MAGFAPLKTARDLAKFRRLQRILRTCGHDLHRCPPESPDYAERGNYYATCDDGGLAIQIDLDDALLQVGDSSTERWHVDFMLAMYSPENLKVTRPVKGKPGYWEMVTPQEVA